MGPCAHGGEHKAIAIKSNGKMLFGCAAFSADAASNSDKPSLQSSGILDFDFPVGLISIISNFRKTETETY